MSQSLSPEASGQSQDSKPPVRKHRVSHTKSRNGCHTCKLRRVKCDEVRPTCGACSLRGDRCSFPSKFITAYKPPGQSEAAGERTTPSGRDEHLPCEVSSQQAGSNHARLPETAGQQRPLTTSLQPLDFGVPMSPRPVNPSCYRSEGLNMNDLRLLQHFLMYTTKETTLNPRRRLVWERVIPEFAAKNEFLMHLVLALAGMHLMSQERRSSADQQLPQGQNDILQSIDSGSDSVDIHIITEHHQRGLQGFREELTAMSATNAEAVLAGSLLLVGFALASLHVRDLDQSVPPLDDISMNGSVPGQPLTSIHKPRIDWSHLIRGLSTVAKEHCFTLRTGRLRQMLFYQHANDDWKDLPSFPTSFPRLHNASPRVSKFAEGARQAIFNLRTFSNTLKLAPASQSLSNITPPYPGWILEEHTLTIDLVETMYMRILYVLQFSGSELDCATTVDVLTDIEDTAVTSWPHHVSNGFICSLESNQDLGLADGLSFTILAHLYLISALFEKSWYLQAFDR